MNLSSFQPIEKQEIIYKQRPVKVFKKTSFIKMNQALIYLGYHVDAKHRCIFRHAYCKRNTVVATSRLFVVREKYNLNILVVVIIIHNTMLVVAQLNVQVLMKLLKNRSLNRRYETKV